MNGLFDFVGSVGQSLLRKIAFNFANFVDSMKGKSIKKKMIDYMIDLDLFNRLIYEIVPNRA